MLNIIEVANKLNLDKDELIFYGDCKAKINLKSRKKIGKLILVTSTNPTPYGEGKTTLSIGLCDSLNKLGKLSVADLREPSLGPVFGKKGGAVGGGKSKVIPSDDINLHFNGDFHAITSANNLLCAIIDNHIFQGNELNIDKVTFKRCIDINDRSLRGNFVITPASEIMAILCLSKDIEDLKSRIGNIIIGYTKDEKEVYARDLKVEEPLTILLKDAIKPNLVQTLYGNPVIIHGGPFANIAHGCSSIIGTKTALSLADYVITEAGFGSDMGALKFFDIKLKDLDVYPDAVIINTTIRALKYNGDGNLDRGIENLKFHIDNMKKFNNNIIVALNKFGDDTKEEIEFTKSYCEKENVLFSICEMYDKGIDGCIDLANQIINMNENKIKYNIYDINDSIEDKIIKICSMFGANNIVYEKKAREVLERLENSEFSKLNVCIAKTPNSITDDKSILGYPKNFTMTVTDIKVYNGAGFIVAYMGNILTMPGLSKNSNYLNMKIENDIISGLV